jgi:hypothetical protein
MSDRLPEPRLTRVYRLEAMLGEPLDLAEVMARLARGDDIDASEYTFRTWTQIETAAAELDWLNKGIFIGVGGRRAGGVTYETYLVG